MRKLAGPEQAIGWGMRVSVDFKVSVFGNHLIGQAFALQLVRMLSRVIGGRSGSIERDLLDQGRSIVLQWISLLPDIRWLSIILEVGAAGGSSAHHHNAGANYAGSDRCVVLVQQPNTIRDSNRIPSSRPAIELFAQLRTYQASRSFSPVWAHGGV
jgi:hypothetical protein